MKFVQTLHGFGIAQLVLMSLLICAADARTYEGRTYSDRSKKFLVQPNKEIIEYERFTTEDGIVWGYWPYNYLGDTVEISSVDLSNRPELTELEFPSKLLGKDVVRVAFVETTTYGPSSQTCTWTSLSQIKKIVLPLCIREIGAMCFQSCNLETVNIEGHVAIGERAFTGNARLVCVNAPLVDSIGVGAFKDCLLLEDINVGEYGRHILVGADAFDSTHVDLEDRDGYLYFRGNCMGINKYAERLVITNGTQEIDGSMCAGMTNLVCVIFPSTLRYVAANAFSRCTKLEECEFPEGLTAIGSTVFTGCSRLRRVVFPSSLSAMATPFASSSLCSLQELCFKGNAPLLMINVGPCEEANKPWICDSMLFRSMTNDFVISVREGTRGWTGDQMSFKIPDLWPMGCGVSFRRRVVVNQDLVSTNKVDEYLQKTDARYELSSAQKDRAIASVTVDADMALDNFVLTDGKVYDSVLYINNVANRTITLRLPSGNIYKAFKSASPLLVPAQSQCILTITRIAESVFLVSREDLETIQ